MQIRLNIIDIRIFNTLELKRAHEYKGKIMHLCVFPMHPQFASVCEDRDN